MATERLILAIEDDQPVGCVLERVTLANLDDAAEDWFYFLDHDCDLDSPALTQLPAVVEAVMNDRMCEHRARSRDAYYYTMEGDIYLSTQRPCMRVRFDAGAISGGEPCTSMDELRELATGTVLFGPVEGFMYVLRWIDGVPHLRHIANADAPWRDAAWFYIPQSRPASLHVAHVLARDDHVLK